MLWEHEPPYVSECFHSFFEFSKTSTREHVFYCDRNKEINLLTLIIKIYQKIVQNQWKEISIRESLGNENYFVNFTGATFALATHIYTSMHRGRLHQQFCRRTWQSILSQIFFREKKTRLITNVKRENDICLCTHFDNRIIRFGFHKNLPC